MKKLLLFIVVGAVCVSVSAQKPKEVRDLNLKTKTTWVTEKKGKKEISYKGLELRFDKDGNLIQEITFNAKGNITKNISYQYDGKNKIRELHHNSEGKIMKRIEFVYSKKVLSEIHYYNGEGELLRKEQFIYEQQY